MSQKNAPTPKAEAGKDQPAPEGAGKVRTAPLDHEQAAELARGPAGSQMNDRGEIQLPDGATEQTRKEAHESFGDRRVHMPQSAQSAQSAAGGSHTRMRSGETDFEDAVEKIAKAVKKFTEAGLGGQAAAELAHNVYMSTCGRRY